MPSRSRLRAAAAALLCVLLPMSPLATVAHAEAFLVTGQGGLGYSLVDLDLNDGISPSLRLQVPPLDSSDWYEAGYALVRTDTGSGSIHYREIGDRPRLQVRLGRDGVIGEAWVDGRGALATVNSGIEVSAHGDGSQRLYTEAHAGSGELPFILSPHTGVRFHLDTWFDGRADAVQEEGFAAQSSLYASLDEVAGMSRFDSSDRWLSVPHDWTGTYAVAGTTRLDVWVANDSDGEVAGQAWFSSWAWAASHVSPVPEPAHAAMFAAGLGLLGLRWRRRGRGARR